jgi:hypothetical protein
MSYVVNFCKLRNVAAGLGMGSITSRHSGRSPEGGGAAGIAFGPQEIMNMLKN